jgi:hypothetical protein
MGGVVLNRVESEAEGGCTKEQIRTNEQSEEDLQAKRI